MPGTIVPFVRKSLDINNTLLEVFNDKLGLPAGTLAKHQLIDEFSGSETRCTFSPPTFPGDTKETIGSHTDFGSLSFLHNRLGGLQVLVPGKNVAPISGHAICNLGDAMAIFSGGILRSNLHRVIPPPGSQEALDRWSLVYFTRPGNSVKLRALESPMIAEAVANTPERSFDTGSTSLEWFSRRIKTLRIKNRKGPETWIASRGTEWILDA